MEGASRAAAYGRWNLCGDAGKNESTAVIIPADSVASISCGMENYRATIGFKGKRFYIGTFVDYQDAVQARQEAESTIHEGFVRAWYSWNRQAEK